MTCRPRRASSIDHSPPPLTLAESQFALAALLAPLNHAHGRADTKVMAAAVLEPISPELVLVCPELRAQAIALLPDFSWQTFVAQARARSVPQAPERIVGARGLRDVLRAAVEIAGPLPWALAWFVCGTLGTLTLTLIADATR